MSESTEKTLRLVLPAFDVVCNWDTALESGGDSDLPSSENNLSEDADESKKQKDAIKKNKVALANLTMAFTTSSLMALIKESKSNDWPEGLAYKVV
eukprot:15343566-Ditylum_brightwellii.AAC.1